MISYVPIGNSAGSLFSGGGSDGKFRLRTILLEEIDYNTIDQNSIIIERIGEDEEI